MKISMVKELEWLDEYRVGNIVVRHYKAHHKEGKEAEHGLAFVLYQGQYISNVRCPVVNDCMTTDSFTVRATSRWIAVPMGCHGFMSWVRWYDDAYPDECSRFVFCLMHNFKVPVSGLSQYIKDKVTEEKQ